MQTSFSACLPSGVHCAGSGVEKVIRSDGAAGCREDCGHLCRSRSTPALDVPCHRHLRHADLFGEIPMSESMVAEELSELHVEINTIMEYESNTKMDLDNQFFAQYQIGMSRLKSLREARGLTQTQLADLIGTSQPQVMRLENGQRKMTKEWAEKLAPHLAVNAQDLIFAPGETNLGGRVPATSGPDVAAGPPFTYRPPPQFFDGHDLLKIYASAEGGNGTLILSTEPYEHLPRPHTLDGIPEAYGILIEGESMFPAFEPGDIAWVNPRLGPRKGTDVILYGIDDRTSETRATVKRLVSATEKDWSLQQWNPPKKFKLDRGIWRECHRVVGKFSKK